MSAISVRISYDALNSRKSPEVALRRRRHRIESLPTHLWHYMPPTYSLFRAKKMHVSAKHRALAEPSETRSRKHCTIPRRITSSRIKSAASGEVTYRCQKSFRVDVTLIESYGNRPGAPGRSKSLSGRGISYTKRHVSS